MKTATILVSLFVVFTGIASAITSWPLYATASLAAVIVAAAWQSGHQMVGPLQSWWEWKKLERHAIEHQRRINEFDGLFADIRESAEPVSDYDTVHSAAEEVFHRELLPSSMDIREIWAAFERGGWLIGVELNSYPKSNPITIPDNYQGIAFAYRVTQTQNSEIE